MTMIPLIGKLARDARGATAVEYGLIIALVVLGMMAGLVVLARTTTDVWSNVAQKVNSAGT